MVGFDAKTGRSVSPPTIAVVVGAGGIKTFAALALFEFLDEAGIVPDLLIGCSGGGIMSALRATGHSPARMQELIPELLNRELFSSLDFRALLGLACSSFLPFDKSRGFLRPERLRALFRRLWGETRLEELQPKTLLQVTDFHSGQGHILERGLLADAVYASAASYPALPPICLEDRWLVDGGFTSPCPILEAVKRHVDVIIALTIETKFSEAPDSFPQLFTYGQSLCANHMMRNQMATAINLHHYEIIQINVRFDRNIEFWEFAEIPYILETGRNAVAAKKEAVLSAIANFPAYQQNAAAPRF